MSSDKPIRILLAGEGAIASIHMQALQEQAEARVVALAGGVAEDCAAFARQWGIAEHSLDFASSVQRADIDAVILASPSHLHAEQAALAIAAGKHVLAEIPMALSLADAETLCARASVADLVCMVAHTRRFSPAHHELKRQIRSGEFHLQHLVCETYFFRRDNRNLLGRSRSWSDHLLWHHACHSVDLFAWLLDEEDFDLWGCAGPLHPELGSAMDMSIGMRSASGAMATLLLSFNHRGPFGGFYRYIGEEATFQVCRDELKSHEGEVRALHGCAYARQDREFLAAIREGREPESSFADCLRSMRLLDRLEGLMASGCR